MPKKKKIKHCLEFCSVEYDDNCNEYLPVKLDGKIILKLSRERFMGHLKDKTKEVCEALTKELGIEITSNKLKEIRSNGGFFEI